MPKFFIERPIFAWVVAIFVMLAGLLAIKGLPVAQYPAIAPPQVTITATYPGASAETLEKSVTMLIEDEINGVEGLKYMESQSASNGVAQILVTFESTRNVDLAAVDVQNRVKIVESRLPSSVMQQGVQITKSRSNFMMVVMLDSSDPSFGSVELGDYLARNVVNEIKRVPGVGDIKLLGTETAMRIWLDPTKMAGLKLTATDIASALEGQNVQVAAGSVGALPNPESQKITANIVVSGQLQTVEEFENVVLRANTDGSYVRLGDVARVELGGKEYGNRARLNGKNAAAIAVLPSSTANALDTAAGVKARMEELSQYFPNSVTYSVPYDTTKFINISISKVVQTLFEAVALVFIVMFIFLQNIRYTIIPTIVVPVSLLGTFAVMSALGFSINVLTLFGMVLSIGILVDDAIVVVENVERIMATEGLPPKEATQKAMGQISSAVVGMSVVAIAVFIPMAFFGGAVGAIYKQFSIAVIATVFFSAIMALSLTPALCATILKPIDPEHAHSQKGFFGAFNRIFGRITNRYESGVTHILARLLRYGVIYGAIIIGVGFLYWRLPTSFLPTEDQGYVIANVELPAGSTYNRALDVVEKVENHFQGESSVENVITVTGFSFNGSGQNAAIGFIPLRDWGERSADESAQATIGRAFKKLYFGIKEAVIFPVNPPAIRELGNATGFTFRLQDRAGLGYDALVAARNQLLGMAAQNPMLTKVRPEGFDSAPQLNLSIDRKKANALGLNIADINTTLSAMLGSAYVNDFDSNGRQQRVILQVDENNRVRPEDVDKLYVRNNQGEMVPFSSFSTSKWSTGPVQLTRYNGYPAIKISGEAAAGMSSGDAMNAMVSMMDQLPKGFGYEWTGQSLEEQAAGSQAPMLYALSMLAVFLCLAALYESLTIPLSVMLVVPLGVLGALLGVMLRGMPNDVYFKVGLITTIGLSAKNAILIVEYAKDLQEQGKELFAATMEAVKLRFRPILMTSLTFILGVLPLVFSTGGGAASRQAIGTGVMFGMLIGTFLALFFVPLFYVVIRKTFDKKTDNEPEQEQAETPEPAVLEMEESHEK